MRLFHFGLLAFLSLTVVHCGPGQGKKSDLRRSAFVNQRVTKADAEQKESVEPSPEQSRSSEPESAKDQSYSNFMLQEQLRWKTQLEAQAGPDKVRTGNFQNSFCADGVDCKDYVVSVTSSAGNCAGVLLTPTIAMTNRHCIEDLATELFGDLTATISVVVPKRFASSERVSGELYISFVKRVVGLSPKQFSVDGMQPDYAFLELQEELSGAENRRLNFSGIQDGETYFIYATPAAGATGQSALAFERRACRAVYQITSASFFDSPKDPIILFPDCPIGPANSGSPIYNADGELVGLIAGQMRPSTILSLQMLALSFGVSTLEQPLTNVGWGVNLACIPDISNLDRPLPIECDVDFASPTQNLIIPADLQSRLRGDLSGVGLEDDKFKYKLALSNVPADITKTIFQGMMLQVPDCVRPEAVSDLQDQQQIELNYSALKLSPLWILLEETTGPKKQNFQLQIEKSKFQGGAETTMQLELPGGLRVYKDSIKVCE